MVALMGPSGAGKSSLLNILSFRVRPTAGLVHYGAQAASQASASRLVGFVEQDDLLFASLTVMEHMQMQAALRMPRSTRSARTAAVWKLLEGMGLAHVESSRIGGAMQGAHTGLSGGERKRLCFATECLSSPSILFADEPTTGLDSHKANVVVRLLQHLAVNEGKTVVCTIHQPASKTFQLFQNLLLLSHGRLLYYGPRVGALEWFATRLAHQCPAHRNPADFFIEVLALKDLDAELKASTVDKWATLWKEEGSNFLHSWRSLGLASNFFPAASAPLAAKFQSKAPGNLAEENAEELKRNVNDISPNANDSEMTKNLTLAEEGEGRMCEGKEKKIGTCRINLNAFWILLKRCFLLVGRDPVSTYYRLIITIVVALFPSLMFFRLGWSSKEAFGRVGASFIMLLAQGFLAMIGVATTFPPERPIVQREVEGGVVKMGSYFVARITAESWTFILFPFIFNTICFWIIRIGDGAVKWLSTSALMVLSVQTFVSWGYLVSALIKDASVALVVLQLFMMAFVFGAGFILKLSELHPFWYWLVYLSPFKYSLAAYTTVAFEDEIITNGPAKIDGQNVESKRKGRERSGRRSRGTRRGKRRGSRRRGTS
eukprot:GHVT01042821.1.p1 GENE.GHVT01042821.1~~GHVT01042821.1.p1  ORF type:complete len:602 (+),score=126.06 GHVT01042821.1:803-2608(+)